MSKCRDNVCLFRNSRHSYAFDFSKCDIDRYFEQEYVRSRGRGQVCGYTRVAIYTCTHYVYLHVNSWRRRATGAPTPAPATAPGAAAWTGDTRSSSRGCSVSSAGHSHTQSYRVDNNNYEPVLGDQIVNSEPANAIVVAPHYSWALDMLQLIATSTSNPFLCAADFFLQLGSCKEDVR